MQSLGGQWPDALLQFMYWLPTCFEFAAYTLFVVFLAQLIHNRRWDAHKHKYYIVWAVAQAVLVVVNLAWIISVLMNGRTQTAIQLRIFMTAFMFLVLTVLVLVYSYMLLRAIRNFGVGVTKSSLLNPLVMKITSPLLTSLFLSRAVYDFVVLGIYRPGDDANFGIREYLINYFEFGSLLLWEILPMYLVFVVFAAGKASKKFTGMETLPSVSRFETGSSLQAQPPALYESDPEPGRDVHGGRSSAESVNTHSYTSTSGGHSQRVDWSFLFSNPSRYDMLDEERASLSHSSGTSVSTRGKWGSLGDSYGSLGKYAASRHGYGTSFNIDTNRKY